MKKIILLIVLCFAFDFGYGQTTLTPGDVVITGFNSENSTTGADIGEQFSFVLLSDVSATTEIRFTDLAWLSTNNFRGGSEGVLIWTATSYTTCGTEITVNNSVSPATVSAGTITELSGNFALNATSGDQILVYQGTQASPDFISAIHFANTNGWSNISSPSDSSLPTGLTNGVNAIDFGDFENGNYNCAVVSGNAAILSALTDATNWTLQDAPLTSIAGCGFTCDPCSSTTTWDGSSWNAGIPTSALNAVIDGNYTATAANSFSACSLWINSGNNLTITDGYVEVVNDVTVNGTLIVETEGNFVQRDDTGTFTNNGTSRVNKTTASKDDWYYYTYWSSPVLDETVANVFPDVDGDRRFLFNANNFIDTDGDNIDDDANAWTATSGTMTPGVGYAVTETRFFMAPGTGSAVFEGQFNTGDINAPISYNASNTDSWNFIGNPYPSAIDFEAFYAANSSVVDGTAYFWSQATDHSRSTDGNEQSNFSQNDYAMYTAGSGGTAATSGTTEPSQYIPSGQGFFVAGLDNNTATFTNAMRMADATSNTQFFKNSDAKQTTSSANRLWINLTSDNGVFNQILVAYVSGATNGIDGGAYDAKRFLTPDFNATLYSTIQDSNNKYAIQGKATASLTEDEIINLGFATNIDVATLYKFSLAQLEGDFLEENTIYLKDNLLNKVHNLTDSDYTFTSDVGEFNDRFEIQFKDASVLSTESNQLDANALKIIELENDNVQFTASKNIKAVSIYDLLGRQLYQFEGKTTSEIYNLSQLKSSIYIAKVEFSNGTIITKKALKK